jgi:hypothetical protein
MTQKQRNNFVVGFVLILLGGYFLAVEFVPGLENWIGGRFEWPMLIIGFGLLLFIAGLLSGAPGFAIPASIVSGIGGILYWQNETGNYGSWAYIWTLIPGFVGVGTILLGILSRGNRRGIREGFRLIAISVIMFLLFGSFFGVLESDVFRYWPVLLIFYGLFLLFGMLTRKDGTGIISSSAAPVFEPEPAEPVSEAEPSEPRSEGQ